MSDDPIAERWARDGTAALCELLETHTNWDPDWYPLSEMILDGVFEDYVREALRAATDDGVTADVEGLLAAGVLAEWITEETGGDR